jgi:DNA-binding NarL/FixJ family response regulator
MYQTGKYSVSELAFKFDVSMASIYNVLSGRLSGCKANDLFRKTSPEGAKRGDRIKKVNSEIIMSIGSLRAEGKSFAEIGRVLDLNPKTVKKYTT